MEPEKKMTMTKGARIRMARSMPSWAKKLRDFFTPQTLLNTFSTRIIIQMTSQTNIKEEIKPKTPFWADAMMLSAAFITTSITSGWLLKWEYRSCVR